MQPLSCHDKCLCEVHVITSLTVMGFSLRLYLWLASRVAENQRNIHEYFPFCLKICHQCTKHCSINQSETVAGAVDTAETILFYLSVSEQLLILIQRSPFNQSSFSSIKSWFFTCEVRGNSCSALCFRQSSWTITSIFIRTIDCLWMRRKICVTKLFVSSSSTCGHIKIRFFISLCIQSSSSV